MRGLLSLVALLSVLLDNGIAAELKLVSACSASLSDRYPPVLKPLRVVIGNDYANMLVSVLGKSVVSKFLISDAGSSCLANMNGTALGEILLSSTDVTTCANALKLLQVPLIQYVIGNLSVPLRSGTSVATDSLIESLGIVDEDEVERMCTLYVDGLVPCLSSQLLPSLATLRSTTVNGCCDAWASESIELFSYTLTGQYTKMAQLLGDVLCATQTPAFNGSSSQRCGYTFLHSSSEVADMTSAQRTTALLETFQVPDDQACRKAEGKAYNNSESKPIQAVESDQYTTSGCVVALDRLATWINKLPLADSSSKSYGIDLQSLFKTGQCVSGATVFPVIQDMIPSSLVDAANTSFSAACLHMPINYADGCKFSRPASLIDWDYEPPQASTADAQEDAKGDTSAINSLQTVPPKLTSNSGAAMATPCPSSTVSAAVILFNLVLLAW